MHNQLILNKIETIRSRLKRIRNHLLHQIGRQTGKLVNMLTSIPRIRNTETKLKVERLQQFVAKKVALYHAKSVDRTRSNREFHPGTNMIIIIFLEKKLLNARRSNSLQFQELRRKLIPHKSARIRV